LTLNLRMESENLGDFEFTITGFNFKLHADDIAKEFYAARSLKPLKILIDGSPFTPQCKLAKMLGDYYFIHHVEEKKFLSNFKVRLVMNA
jgi:hypothetical protein